MLSLPVCLPTQIRAGVVGLTGIRVMGGGGKKFQNSHENERREEGRQGEGVGEPVG